MTDGENTATRTPDPHESARDSAEWMLGWTEDPAATLEHWRHGKMQLTPERVLEIAYEVIAAQRNTIQTLQRDMKRTEDMMTEDRKALAKIGGIAAGRIGER
jgi:hypothetical protein